MADPKKIYRVNTVQEKDGKKFYQEVGRIVLHANGEHGVLFLHMHPGTDFPIFLKKPREDRDEAPADSQD